MKTSLFKDESTDIVINLNDKPGSRPGDVHNLIQRKQYVGFKKQVIDHLNILSSAKNDRLMHHRHDNEIYHPGTGWSFFIDGTRGAGKSTFLAWIKDHIEEDVEIRGHLHFVACIDPSRIERAEIMLLVILERLKQQVDNALNLHRKSVVEQKREDWRQAFKSVAGGLSLLVKDYHPLDGHDPDLFLDWGLERTGNSTHLRAGLHMLFDTAREILGVKALMFAFDDADTDSSHGIEVLECIRKYLDAPIVMVLVTGDMELYSLLLRQHFAKTVVGERNAAIDMQRRSVAKDRSEQYLRMINHLEEQYLLKLFSIQRRIQLKPLWNLIRQGEKITFHYVNSSADEKNIPEGAAEPVIEMIIRQGMRVKSDDDVRMYADFLLKQPIRSVLQVVKHCMPHIVSISGVPRNDAPWNIQLTDALRDSLQALALTSLYKFSIDTDAISVGEPSALTEAVFDLSIEDGDIDTAMYLRPMSASQDIRTSFTALAAEVPRLCSKKPSLAISYMLRTNGSISLFGIAQRHIEKKTSNDASEYVAQFKSYAGIGRAEDGSDWARRATAIIAQPYISNNKIRKVFEGVVGLRKRKSKSRANEITIEKAISDFLKTSDYEFAPAIAFALVNIYSGQVSVYASVFNILGAIEKILSSGGKRGAREAFDRAHQILTISPPKWGAYGSAALAGSEDDSDTEKNATEPENAKFDNLWRSIEKWVGESESEYDRTTPSAVLLGKIWTRLFFSLANASQEMRQKNFSSIMEIFACCTINAFLVEEAEHHLINEVGHASNYTIDRNNPRTSALKFCEKLESMKPQREHLPLTAIIATCPLILGLLNGNKPFALALLPLFPEGTSKSRVQDQLCPQPLWDLMDGVGISAGENDDSDASPSKKSTK